MSAANRARAYGPARRYAASSADLVGLFRRMRENPYDETGHLVAADAIEELHPDSPIPALIRRQFDTSGDRPDNLWYEPVENSWDGTFPYTARLGRHGPFNVYLGHEGDPPFPGMSQGSNQRWIVHAVSNLPGSRDFGYTFEFPHERAHEIPQMFPAAARHIYAQPISGDYAEQARNIESRRFEDAMDAEERRRG